MELKRQLHQLIRLKRLNLPIGRLKQRRELRLEDVGGDRCLVGAGVIEQNNRRGMLTSQIFSDSLLEFVHKLSELDLVRRITYSKTELERKSSRESRADCFMRSTSKPAGFTSAKPDGKRCCSGLLSMTMAKQSFQVPPA